MNLKNTIIKVFENNNYLELERLLNKHKIGDFAQILVDIAYNSENISVYTTVCMLLIKQETSELHCLAAELLVHSFCHLEGAYVGALYHTRKAINLSPRDISLKEFLLFFHGIPEKLISDKEAEKVAQEILKENPNSSAAKSVLDVDNFISNQNSKN